MSKAILVIGNPECCSVCEISHSDLDGYYCPFEPVAIPDEIAMTKKMDWCPLRLLPEKKPIDYKDNIFGEVRNVTNIGYNQCLYDILLGDYITQEEADCCGVQFWHDD